jgi:hypothetical protein
MPPQPHPWVYSANITDGKITFRVQVTGLHDMDGAIEITGEATQAGGAFAPISCITNIPAEPNGVGDDAGMYLVDIEADPTPDYPFEDDQDVTVFVRASKVWVTVLGPGTDDPPDKSPRITSEGPTWGIRRKDARISAQKGGY